MPISSQRGFTLIEVAMASAVLALAIMTTITTLGQGLRTIDSARAITFATQILQDQIEDLRCTAPNVVQAWAVGTVAAVSLDQVYSASTFVSGHNYACNRKVDTVRGKAGMVQVTYTVSWVGIDGKSNSRLMTSYYYQTGLYSYVSN
jgi:prepilin-type N-terminal cleavage/methylation domain-containing protein